MTCRAYNAGRVRLINHYQCVVFLGKFAYLVHRGNVSVHREHAVCCYYAVALCLCFLQASFKVGHVGVGVAVSLSLAEADAVYY